MVSLYPGRPAQWAAVAAAACWALAWAGQATGQEPKPAPRVQAPSDDQTFRPTVLVRKGRSQGSGTVIASVPDETLVLTVAHVVLDPGDLTVELHRYNLGKERSRPLLGDAWPRVLGAKVVAVDRPSDMAIIRVSGMVALPYVAWVGLDEPDPEAGSVVVSVGIDMATHLSSWQARVVKGLDLDTLSDGHASGTARPFLLIDHRPEHGRSGGGLFALDGRLVGVCVGRTQTSKGRELGVFAAGRNISRLVAEHKLASTLERSDRLHASARRPDPQAPGTAVTPTDHRDRPPAPTGRR